MRLSVFHLISALMALTCAACTGLKTSPTALSNTSPLSAPMNPDFENLLGRMTLEEKIGQIIQADIGSVTPEDAKLYNLGSVLNGGNSAPGGSKTASVDAWISLADSFWRASTDTSDGGVGIPLLWGTDAVHGHNNLQSATIFPHNIGLGAAHEPALIEKIGAITAREVRATGLDWTFAPTLAVAQDDRWGRTYESYSEDPDLVAAYAAAMVRGLQGQAGSDDFLKGEHVIATAKHFIGDGGTIRGIDKGDTQSSLADLLDLHGAGYRPAIDQHVQTVMASFSSFNGVKLHGSKMLLKDVLRGQLGFEGFVLGDWNGHAQIPGCTATDCPDALESGIDMYMAPDSWRELYTSLLAHAQAGRLSHERLDEAVRRILRVKFASGLFDAGLPSQREMTGAEHLGTQSHRKVAREAVRKSLVLLKNNHSILPLNPDTRLLIAGSGAASIQQQTGGWTLSWQGNDNTNEEFEKGETIFEGIKKAVEAAGGDAILSVDGHFEEKPDAAIVIFGEQPYAEFKGDRADLVFEFEDGENLQLLKSLKAQNVPVVSVFLTGRPLWISPHINASDAFIVAWLPGTEGGGIADVMIADETGVPRYDFSGQLSFTWPMGGDGTPVNGHDNSKALFPLGYGLTYADTKNLGSLSEDPEIEQASKIFSGPIMANGEAVIPFSFFLGDSTNADTLVTSHESRSLGGVVITQRVDFKAQEDARAVSWNGAGRGDFSIRAPRPLNLMKLANSDQLQLVLNWRIDKIPDRPVMLGIGCGEGCAGRIDLTSIITKLKIGEWSVSSIPLSCFTEAGLITDNVTIPLQLSTDGEAAISLYKVGIEKHTSPCPNIL